MTILLGIETATPACSVAVSISNGDDVQYHSRFEIAPRRHTDLVLPMIDELLSELDVKRTQLDAIALGCGPGSFIGTRLAVSVAQGLGYALDVPLIPVSTLQILAQTAYAKHHYFKVITAWDARMGEVYWGVYHVQNGLMLPMQSDQLSSPHDVTLATEGYALVGNAWSIYWDKPEAECHPHAEALLMLAQTRFAAGEAVSALEVEPVYLRDKVTS